jgi:hypothetical protein
MNQVPWLHTYEDLRGIGVNVSEEQRFTVENGGLVLSLGRLPAIQECGCGDDHGFAMSDGEGRSMMMPMVFKASNPFDSFDPGWKTKDTHSIAYHLEEEGGHYWRLFPSYTGVEHTTVRDVMYDERLESLRVWSGVPLVDPADAALAQDLVIGYRSWLNASVYEEMQNFFWYESEMANGYGEIDLDDEEDENAQSYWALRKDMAKGGFIIELANGDWYPGRPIAFDPLEQHISAPALSLWRKVLHQSRYGATTVLNSLPPDKQSIFTYHEQEIEPWY